MRDVLQNYDLEIAHVDLQNNNVQDVLQKYDLEIERLVNNDNFVDNRTQPIIPQDNIFHWDEEIFEPDDLFGDLFSGGLDELPADNDNFYQTIRIWGQT